MSGARTEGGFTKNVQVSRLLDIGEKFSNATDVLLDNNSRSVREKQTAKTEEREITQKHDAQKKSGKLRKELEEKKTAIILKLNIQAMFVSVKKETMMAGYYASSTECSDHGL